MANRSKRSRSDSDGDAGDSLKPLVVLVLLGTILYGAWSVVNKGPGGSMPGPMQSDLSVAPTFPPAVDVPASSASSPGGATAPSAAPLATPPSTPAAFPLTAAAVPQPAPPKPPVVDANPTYLSAVSAAPPGPESVPPAAVPAPQRAADAAAAAVAVAVPAVTAGLPMNPRAAAAPDAAIESTPQPSAQPAFDAHPGSAAAFATAWADAHDKLAAGRYAEALGVLSSWHDDPSLGLEESQRLEDLLGQLAGTVVYSQQDLLLPPHVVEQGETLLSIAAPLAVPWQLLAKINGVADPARLVAGESLKLVRGPFDAVVSVSRRRLSLRVGGNYAGTFGVVVGRQLRDRVGGAFPVVAANPSRLDADPAGPVQAAWSQSGPRTIPLSEGLAIEGVPDPAALTEDTIPGTSLVVSDRDLADLADILGPGSRVIVRQ